jgi:hypothetical protein
MENQPPADSEKTAAHQAAGAQDLVDDLELNRLTDSRLADGQDPLRVSLAAL